MGAKLDFREITVMYSAATFASITSAGVGGVLWERVGGNTDYVLVIGGTWLVVVGVPSLLVSVDTLRQKLGEIRSDTIIANAGHRPGRSIPFTNNGQKSHLFLSSIPYIKPQPELPELPESPATFTTTFNGIQHTVTLDEIQTFLYGVWRRQRAGEPYPLSRPYWTRHHKPRLKPLEYNTIIKILSTVDGLILNRAKRKSGRLSMPPLAAIKALQIQFELA